MKIALLITNGNMGGTAGDATLILRRARAMYEEKGLFTRILLLKPIKQGDVNKGDYFYSIEMCRDKFVLKQIIKDVNPNYIILYGDKIQMMTKKLHRFVLKNKLKTKVVIDIQGAIEEKKEYANSFFRKLIVYPISRYFFKKAVTNADAAFVVTDEIRDKCQRVRKDSNGELEYFKVRCGFEQLATTDQIISYRQEFRKAKGITDDTIVFCYSGYRASWQKVEDIIEHFRMYDRFNSNCFFAFFCNTDELFNNLLKEKFPKGNYCVELLKPSEYFKSLCGCDVGYILRDYNETNRVAFPNKFSDYLSSGLIIALNDALPEPTRLIKKFPSHYIDTNTAMSDINSVFTKINQRFSNYSSFINTSLELGKSELLYSEQIKKTNL